MKKNNPSSVNISSCFEIIGPYILCALIPMLLFLCFTWIGWIDQPAYIEPLMIGIILFALGFFICRAWAKGFQEDDLITLIIFIGLVMRTGYMLYTGYTTRAHDIGSISEDSHGHAMYIWTIFTKHRLPDNNYNQFYHPPLYYLAAQIPLAITKMAFPNAADTTIVNAAKVVSCFASCSGLLLVKKLCKEISPSKLATVIILAIAALHPNFFQQAGRVNNDGLLIFFELLILLYTVKWYKNQSISNTVILALGYGLGMMTKMSCATLALFTGPVMIYVWIKGRNTPQFWKVFRRGALFIGICAPLGLWYPIRNLILFNQPLTYVAKISETSELYCGNYTFVQRFLSIPFSELTKRTYVVPWDDYNVAVYLFKNSIFGEFTFDIVDYIPNLFTAVNICMIILSLAAVFYVVIRGKNLSGMVRFGLPWLWLTQLFSYYSFQIQFPFGCTMDFRYIPVTAILGGVMIGIAMQLLKEERLTFYKKASPVVYTLTGLFCTLSVVMYCSI